MMAIMYPLAHVFAWLLQSHCVESLGASKQDQALLCTRLATDLLFYNKVPLPGAA